MNRAQLLAIAPAAAAQVDRFLLPLNVAMDRFGIDSPARQAAFLAQILHESLNLTRMTENLNYSADSLIATFNTPEHQRFNPTSARQYGRRVQPLTYSMTR